MTPSARIQAAIELIRNIHETSRPADGVVSAYFRARRYIGSKDRAAVSSLTYDLIRHHFRLNWWLEHLGIEALPRNMTLAYLRLVEKHAIKEVEDLFTGDKFSPEKLSEDDYRFIRKLENQDIHHTGMPDYIRVECPAWAADILRIRFEDKFITEMAAMLTPAPLDLRVNSLKAERGPLLAELQALEMTAHACRFSALGIRVEERPAFNELPMFKNGLVEIQDEGSQLVALMVDAKPGERVVDFCAGAGGKTLAIAAQMNNKGRITACDILENRLKRSSERFRRAGVHNIELKLLASTHDPWIKKHKGSFDRVLVDAPCTGTGTWRRNPDARTRSPANAFGPGLTALVPLQASILDSAARLVKSGGRLIYGTCSLLPNENELQIENFLKAHPDFTILDCREIWHDAPTSPYLNLTPYQHNTDGFFAAIMARSVPLNGDSKNQEKI